MKKLFTILSIALSVAAVSCKKDDNYGHGKETDGTLSFASFELVCDEEVETRATAASGEYVVMVYNSDEALVKKMTYGEVKASGNKMTLPAGNYTLVARSTESEVPASAFERPIYGVSSPFSITAGQTTTLGSLTCTLLQCKVTVSYSDDFLAMVTGEGKTTVTVTEGSPLDFAVNYAAGSVSYDQSAGYFAINNGANTTMEVTFKGSIGGKSQKMTKTFTGIAARQWRQIKFIKKVDEQGNATFDITINSFVEDRELGNQVSVVESVIGDDPSAPKGDGGITLAFDYANGCDSQFNDMLNMVIPTFEERTMSLVFKVTVPNGIKKFQVLIDSTNDSFVNAVAAAGATTLDLINPAPESLMVFDIVPFPYGSQLIGATEVSLNLSAAQEPILVFPGTHSFTMVLTDNKGCKNSIAVKMVVR